MLSAVLIGAGLGLTVAGMPVPGGWGLGVGAVVLGVSLLAQRRRARGIEPERIEQLEETRRNELIRGTSMHLRDMKYRYSVRYDRSEREPFTADVNTVTLGFVPVIIIDNQTDRQGYGYVAFPYDGRRWRGPGLPCGGDRAEALQHAARCVAPLRDEDGDADR
jgi:hypothetical protein